MSDNSCIRKIIFHVGLHKTGTTKIQDTLHEKNNNELLLNENILYPRCWGPNHHFALHSAFADHPEKLHFNIANERVGVESVKKHNQSNLEKFEEELNNGSADTLVLSGENVSTMSRKNISKMKRYLQSITSENVKINIVIYVRDPVKWAVSTIQQRFKIGHNYEQIVNHLNRSVLGYLFRERIGKFMDVFGEESVKVISFEKAIKADSGFVGYFLSSNNLPKDLVNEMATKQSNESMSMITGCILSFANKRVPLFKDGMLNLNRSKDDFQPLFRVEGNKYDIPYYDKERIMDIVQDDVIWLYHHFGIDYRDLEIVNNDWVMFDNIQKSLNDLQHVCSSLTHTLRVLVMEFIDVELRQMLSNDHERKLCDDFISKVYK